MKLALFANDAFGSYVFDTVRDSDVDLVCVVGETKSTAGRLRKKLRRYKKRPKNAWRDLIARFRQRPTPEPPRRSGRSPAAGLPSLRERSEQAGIAYFEDERLATLAFASTLRELDIDLVLVATFGAILRPHIIEVPRRGVVNIHFALLPAYRGMTPELCCLLDGATETGVTAHFIDEGVDTGDVIEQRRVPISPNDGFADLQAKLYPEGRELVRSVLARFAAGDVEAVPQDDSKASKCKLRRGYREISLEHTPGPKVHDILRACLGTRHAPYIIQKDGSRLYLLDAEFVPDADAAQYTSARDTMTYACKNGMLVVREAWQPS
ncbi:MAG: hypothetical protein H6832_08630 [Planctomycetes bacterium]|nr:hypothetical protein [Planctomycetota bacterium]MCB9918455.1 hypothetical protein [Planctomycetota bacterium]